MELLADGPGLLREARVLLVDDEDMIRRTLRRVLEHAGVPGGQIREARSGEEAVSLLASEDFSLLLCDYRMEGLTGVDVLARAAEQGRKAARVLITGYADLEVAVDAINRAQVEAFVQKPWDNEELVRVVTKALAKHRARAAVPARPPGGAAPAPGRGG